MLLGTQWQVGYCVMTPRAPLRLLDTAINGLLWILGEEGIRCMWLFGWAIWNIRKFLIKGHEISWNNYQKKKNLYDEFARNLMAG